ncbi:MAG: ferritin-like domain-containing protein [Mycobacteriales bacterium]
MSPHEQFEGSESELLAMTGTLQDMHEDALPTMREGLTEFGEQLRSAQRGPVSRRIFLMGGLTAVGGVALAACGSSKKSSHPVRTTTGGSTAASGGTGLTGDLKVVGLAAALENLAVGAYGLALSAAQAGKLGKVPPAVGVFATTARLQHQDHVAAWNAVLTGAGKNPVTGTPLSFAGQAVAQLQAAKDIGTVATAALSLEQTAAQTYLFAIANVSSAGGIATAASIAPVEAMHAAILHYVLGTYPVPASFLGTTMAVPLTAFTG